MKNKNILAACLAAAAALLALTGCSHSRASTLANEITFSLDGISEIMISYDEENITFYESESEKLTIKEYMTENKSSYYAKVHQKNGSIQIREGGKPFFKDGFLRRVEVYLPASYGENLTVTTTDGDIDISALDIFLSSLRIDSTAGTVCLNAAEAQSIDLSTTSGVIDADCLKADTIRITTTRGNFSCRKLDGNAAYTTTSGNANIESAVGAGNFRANNSGTLNVTYTEVTGDLSFYNKNGEIRITLPVDLEFEFAATTKNGTISTSFQECISIDGQTTSGIVGEHPAVAVKAETKNGSIEVKQ